MEFNIVIVNDQKEYKLNVKLIWYDSTFEHYQVKGKNKSIVLETNRRLLFNRGLKHKRPTWKLIEGQGYNMGILEKIQDEILKVVTF